MDWTTFNLRPHMYKPIFSIDKLQAKMHINNLKTCFQQNIHTIPAVSLSELLETETANTSLVVIYSYS